MSDSASTLVKDSCNFDPYSVIRGCRALPENSRTFMRAISDGDLDRPTAYPKCYAPRGEPSSVQSELEACTCVPQPVDQYQRGLMRCQRLFARAGLLAVADLRRALDVRDEQGMVEDHTALGKLIAQRLKIVHELEASAPQQDRSFQNLLG